MRNAARHAPGPFRACAVGFIALAAAGCATSKTVGARSDAVTADLERVRLAGGATCAPKELALAEANLEFARADLEDGNPEGANAHVRVAGEQTDRALIACNALPPAPKVAEPVKRVDSDGDGVFDDEDRCPDVPGVRENFGCPSMVDTDGDGIPDEVDRCPTQPEDRDGFEDEDGCPDPDNDKDGVADVVDACPNEPGPAANHGCPIHDQDGDGVADAVDKCPDVAGPADNGGCPVLDSDNDGILDTADACPNEPGVADPDPKRNGCPRALQFLVVKPEKIELKDRLVVDSARPQGLSKRSKQVLDEVAQVLRDDPRIRKVQVSTTSGLFTGSGLDAQARADAVRAYLISKGVAAERLAASSRGPKLGTPANTLELSIVARDSAEAAPGAKP